jgi:hypothetical protein
MGFYIAPEYFQTIHYYFFSLGIISFTSAVLFWGYGIYTYLFIIFYIVHSIISWYISWFMYLKMKEIFIINTLRYSLAHVFLTLWTGGLSVLFWYFFSTQYEAMLTSLLAINFFAVFLGVIWYLITRFKLTEKVFEWQESKDLRSARGSVIKFRKDEKIKLVEDNLMKKYHFGSNSNVDRLFLQAQRQQNVGDKGGFVKTIKNLETKMCESRINDLQAKIDTLEKMVIKSETERQLLRTYQNLIRVYTKRMLDYDRVFHKKYRK